MARPPTEADVELAETLLLTYVPDDKVVAALVYRGVDESSATALLTDLKTGPKRTPLRHHQSLRLLIWGSAIAIPIVALVAWGIYSGTPSGQLARVKRLDKVEAYQEFLARFRYEPQAEVAKAALQSLLDRQADRAWTALSNSTSLKDLRGFTLAYLQSPHAQDAQKRIDSLCSNYSWVKAQDKMPIYQRFLALSPNSPDREDAEARLIAMEIEKLSLRRHNPIPQTEMLKITPGAGHATIELVNRSPYNLTLLYSGPEARRVALSPDESQILQLKTGPYQVAARVAVSGIDPFLGREEYREARYLRTFTIQTMTWAERFLRPP